VIQPNWVPDRASLRRFGIVGLVAFGLFAAWVAWRSSLLGIPLAPGAARTTTVVLASLAALCSVLAVAAPRALLPLYVGLTLLTLPIGFVVSHVLLAVVYFGLLTPVGWLLRLLKRDPLARGFRPDLTTYWIPEETTRDPRRYLRQY
jgi:hypothetical protein